MNLERRYLIVPDQTVQLEARADDQPPVITGYGAVFYDGSQRTEYKIFPDLYERIMPGAFDRAVKEDDVRALFNHDPNLLLGRTSAGTMRLALDAKGLRYEIDPPDTTVGRDVKISLQRKDVTGSSFSFRVEKQTWVEEQRDGRTVEIRQIDAVQLYDVGPVTFPAYTATEAGLRSEERAELQRQVEQVRRGRFDPAEAEARRRRLLLAEME